MKLQQSKSLLGITKTWSFSRWKAGIFDGLGSLLYLGLGKYVIRIVEHCAMSQHMLG